MAVTEGTTNLPNDAGARYFLGFYGTDSNFYIPRAIGSSANSGLGTLRTSHPLADFAVEHNPGSNAQATISQAAGAAGVKNVAAMVSATLTSTGATAFEGTANLRDGASGAGTIKWLGRLCISAVADSFAALNPTFPNPIPGTAATAMTMEFTASTGSANVIATVALVGMLVS